MLCIQRRLFLNHREFGPRIHSLPVFSLTTGSEHTEGLSGPSCPVSSLLTTRPDTKSSLNNSYYRKRLLPVVPSRPSLSR